jgi:Alkaline phosphatase PhoX
VSYRVAHRVGLIAIAALAATACGDDGGTTSAQTEPTTDSNPSAPPHRRGFDTREPSQLVATAPRVKIDPILTTGDVVGDYQMSGVPDGLGAYDQHGRIQLYMNHELDGTPSDARVSHLTLKTDRKVVAGEYVVDGSEGFTSFCSSSLSIISGVPTYLTGEESLPGRAIALDATSGEYRETNQVGYFEHENVIALKGLPFGLLVSTEDGPPDHSQLYAYSADSLDDALVGEGQLLVWKADGEADSSNDIAKGETLAGRFVPLSEADNADAKVLEAAAQREGAFDFTRLEDVAQSKTDPSVIYFDDTGDSVSESKRGRVYRLDLDAASGQGSERASLTLLLDGDDGDDIVNPDNLDTSRKALVIDEDRSPENQVARVAGGYSRVLVYDLKDEELRPVARVRTADALAPGTWESSGVLNASRLLGERWWLIDVQSHSATKAQPGRSLEPDSSSGEDGQLLAIRIPGSAP